jgi:hypothetical protein
VAEVNERDTTRPEHHVVFLRWVACGAKGCKDRAHRWMRCRCGELVARCGAHDQRLSEQRDGHCAANVIVPK